MESVKYIGLDVHQSTISVAVLNAEGKLTMQSVIATKANCGARSANGIARSTARHLRRRALAS